VNATLYNGPIIDLNVMTRRSTFRHSVQRRSGTFFADAAGNTTLVLALDPLTISSGNGKDRLESLDSLMIESDLPFTVETHQSEGAFFLISLERI
jgi:environmental stress-induced protein Ves